MSRLIGSASGAWSGEIGCQRSKKLVHRELERVRVARGSGTVMLEVRTHTRGVDHEARAQDLEEIEARSEEARELGHHGELRLPAAERALVLAERGGVQ